MIATPLRLFVSRELRTKQTIVLGVVGLLPAVIAAIVRLARGGSGGVSMIEGEGAVAFTNVLCVIVPMFLAVSAFHEEFESRTIVYLLTRPPTRASYVASKLLSAWGVSTLLLSIGVLALAAVCAYGNFDNPSYWIATTGKLLVTVASAAAVYTTLFLVFGLWFKNPVLIGLAFSFGWENLISYLPGSLRYWTIGYYPRSLFIRWADVDPEIFGYSGVASTGASFQLAQRIAQQALVGDTELPPIGLCAAAMAGITAAGFLLAVTLFKQREDA